MTIKVNYDPQTTLVKGYYPDSINYASIPNPFIEIEDSEQDNSKQMCVIDGVYQEYIKPLNIQLEEAKAAKIIQLKKDKDTALYTHIEYLDTFFISSEKATQNILGTLALNGDNNLWLDSNGHKVTLSKMQLKELGILIKNQRTAAYVKEASYTSQIKACTTIEELNSINIEF